MKLFNPAVATNVEHMVVTTKVFLDERRQKDDNTYPIKIRITADRKSKEVKIGHSIRREEWNFEKARVRSIHPTADLINLKISKTLAKIQEEVFMASCQDKPVETTDIIRIVFKQRKHRITFSAFAMQEIQRLKDAGRIGNASAYTCALNKLVRYAPSHILIDQVNYSFIEAFVTSLQAEGMKPNAIACYLREIRAIWNKAIKADAADARFYPFNKYRIKTVKTPSRTLSKEEIQRLIVAELKPNTPMALARDRFLLSFCLVGVNFIDMFKLTTEQIRDDRIVFYRSKTHKMYSVKLHPQAQAIINKYRSGLYLVPLKPSCYQSAATFKKEVSQAVKDTNKYLKRLAIQLKISKPVTTYYARYSWANIARSLGYSKEIISQALGHQYGNLITGIYLDDYDNIVIDDANDSVIKAVFQIMEDKGAEQLP